MGSFSNSEEYLMFCQETSDVLSKVNDEVLRLESEPENMELLNSIFRGIHTIKGCSGFFELNNISEFSHHLETMLNQLREGTLKAGHNIVDLILKSSDHLNEMLEGHKDNVEIPADEELIAELKQFHVEEENEYESLAKELKLLVDEIMEYVISIGTEISSGEMIELIQKRLHTVKGLSLFLGIDAIHGFAKQLEELLSAIKEGSLEQNLAIVEIIRQGIEHLKSLVEKYNCNEEIKPDEEIIRNIKAVFKRNDYQLFFEQMKKVLLAQNENILKLEAEPGNVQYLNHIFRNARALRGCAAFFGLDAISELSRQIEAAMDHLISNKKQSSPEIIEVLFASIDHLSELSENLISGEPAVQDDAIIEELRRISGFTDAGGEDSPGEEIKIDEENVKEFLISANELLEVLERNAFEYERNDSKEIVNEIFRVVHTLKSDSGYIGLKAMADYTHILESLLDKIRLGKIERSNKIVDLILKSTDILKTAILNISNGKYDVLSAKDIAALKTMVDQTGQNEQCEPPLPGMKDENNVYKSHICQYKEIILECISEIPLDIERKKIIVRSLGGLKNAAQYMGQPDLAAEAGAVLKKLEEGNETDFLNASRILLQKIENVMNDGSTAAPKEAELVKPAPQKMMPENRSAENEIRTMRVDENKIDYFNNLIGELLVAKNTYEYILNEAGLNSILGQKFTRQFKDNLHLFSRLTNELQTGVLSLRMVPIKGIFQKFTRVVRDIAKKQDKIIELVTTGLETEIDKKVSDTLSEPLIHIIRNSCDHGIETPAERRKRNKPEKGTILLSASQEGSELIIKINDDGGGINREKLINKAVNLGLSIDKYDESNILDLIFEPGLSTKSEVSDLSGRGVGMDVVKTTIKKLGGDIKVVSKEGEGTEMTLKVPMSMGISVALLVESIGNTYAIPLDSIMETLKLDSGGLMRIHDRLGFNYRGDTLPLDYLDKLLLKGSAQEDKSYIYKTALERENQELSIVVLKSKKGKYAVIVDKMIKNLELSVKQPPEGLAKIELISGVSILGDGKVVLVLNPEKLV